MRRFWLQVWYLTFSVIVAYAAIDILYNWSIFLSRFG